MLLAGKDQHHERREQNDTDDRRHNTARDALNQAVHARATESESMTLEEEGSPDAGDHGQCSVIDNVHVLDVAQTLFLSFFLIFFLGLQRVRSY